MSARSILVWLFVVWVGLGVLGAARHVVKLLLWVALLASAVVVVAGAAWRR